MQHTGYDTLIFSVADPACMAVKVLSKVRERWPRMRIDIAKPRVGWLSEGTIPSEQVLRQGIRQRRVSLYVFKNKEMIDHLDNKGYTTMRGGEGPLAIHTRARSKIRFHLSRLTEVSTGTDAPAPYEAWLCGRLVQEIGVVTPGNPKTDPFSQWICNVVLNACV